MSFYYTKSDELLKSPINKTFAELFTCSEETFVTWANDFCDLVAKQWDEHGQPPKAGVRLEDMGKEFTRLCKVDTDKMWFKDEQTRQTDCLVDGARVYIANNFFPNILKAKDTLGEGKAISVYDLFVNQSARPTTLATLKRCIREDGFYDFAPVYRAPNSFKGDLRREARRFVEMILKDEAAGAGERSLWIDASAKVERRTPRINVKELKSVVLQMWILTS